MLDSTISEQAFSNINKIKCIDLLFDIIFYFNDIKKNKGGEKIESFFIQIQVLDHF